eukprot:XP_001705449.1 Hypothetical protein GL50803_19351 [Giardia lamblia ATCC 50803]
MRLLPKSRLAPAHEPPAEEADEAPHNNDDSDRDPRYGACAEAALVRAPAVVVGTFHEITEDRATTRRWRGAVQAITNTFDSRIIFITGNALRSRLIVSSKTRCASRGSRVACSTTSTTLFATIRGTT